MPAACPSCQTPFAGAYCHACGEKRLAPEDRTVRHFLHDALGTLTNVDGTLWRSFGLLLGRPGALTRAYLLGERRPYLTPFRLFLLCNVVYFFVQPYTGFSGFNTPLDSQRTRQVYSRIAGIDARVRGALQGGAETPEAFAERYRRYAERFDARSSTYARTLILLLIPAYALALKAVLPRRLYADHLAFAAHFLAWQLLVVMSAYLLLYRYALFDLVDLLPDGLAWRIHENGSSLLLTAYLYLMLRRAFGLSRRGAAWRTVVLQGAAVLFLPALFSLAVIAHRFGLFWLTFWTTPVPP